MHVAPCRYFGAIPGLGVIFCKAIILKRQEQPLDSIGLFTALGVWSFKFFPLDYKKILSVDLKGGGGN